MPCGSAEALSIFLTSNLSFSSLNFCPVTAKGIMGLATPAAVLHCVGKVSLFELLGMNQR